MVSLVDVVRPGLPGDHASAQAGHGDDRHHVDQVDGRQAGEDDQPEPEGHVDLLIDDVEAENVNASTPIDEYMLTGAQVIYPDMPVKNSIR